MDTALYYTFSTISQTLAGAAALLGAFVLYRFQVLNSEMDASAAHVRTFATGSVRHLMDLAFLEGRPDKILELAGAADREDFSGIGLDDIRASQERLGALVQRKSTVFGRMKVSLFLTMALVGFSVFVLAITPYLAAQHLAPATLGIGVLWCWACLSSHVRVLMCALE